MLRIISGELLLLCRIAACFVEMKFWEQLSILSVAEILLHAEGAVSNFRVRKMFELWSSVTGKIVLRAPTQVPHVSRLAVQLVIPSCSFIHKGGLFQAEELYLLQFWQCWQDKGHEAENV